MSVQQISVFTALQQQALGKVKAILIVLEHCHCQLLSNTPLSSGSDWCRHDSVISFSLPIQSFTGEGAGGQGNRGTLQDTQAPLTENKAHVGPHLSSLTKRERASVLLQTCSQTANLGFTNKQVEQNGVQK